MMVVMMMMMVMMMMGTHSGLAQAKHLHHRSWQEIDILQTRFRCVLLLRSRQACRELFLLVLSAHRRCREQLRQLKVSSRAV